jgi:CBS domain-containing protein
MPVVDRSKRLVGVVSLGDLATATGDDETAGKALSDISE